MNKLDIFISRLSKIRVEVELYYNYPWVYLGCVNKKVVNEKFRSDYGFTLGYVSSNPSGDFKFEDLTEIFKLIRKYK